MQHDAFISYSHAVDRPLAAAFEAGLERLAKPLLKLRALDVFRDETGLAASPGLWPSIERQLARSRWLLFFACPESAASPWCERELLWWLARRGPKRLLIVLTGGELLWDRAGAQVDPARSNALPPAVMPQLATEPLYVDLRWARGQAGLSIRHPRFREAVLSVAAPVRGVEKDALDGDDVRQQARNLWWVRGGAVAVTLAGMVAAWQAWEATRERDLAQAQRAEAEGQRRRAEQALAAAGRELLRAQTAELRGLLQRLDGLLAQPPAGASLPRLQQERTAVFERLQRSALAQQQQLAQAMGFRGDLGFLQRWEGRAGGVTLLGDEPLIDPETDLRRADAATIRQRYEFLLTPEELDGVLALVGTQGDAARAAWGAHPALCRIRLAPHDVARLVPEVAERFWQALVQRYPLLLQPTVTPAQQTALLSLAYNIGLQPRRLEPIVALLPGGDAARIADALEHSLDGAPQALRLPALLRRRLAEANLVRAEAGLPVTQPVALPPESGTAPRGPGCAPGR